MPTTSQEIAHRHFLTILDSDDAWNLPNLYLWHPMCTKSVVMWNSMNVGRLDVKVPFPKKNVARLSCSCKRNTMEHVVKLEFKIIHHSSS